MPRFTTEKEITDLIDQYIKEQAELRADAASDDVLADALRMTKEAGRIRGLRDLADKKRAQASWREGRLKTLKTKLAEFRTVELPGCETDGSVQTS